MTTITLPWPPSINHYWRRVGPRTLISREGRTFRENVCALLGGSGPRKPPAGGRIALCMDAFPPDRRKRDPLEGDRGRVVLLTLPYPPSVNHYWRCWRGRTVISSEGRRFREKVAGTLAALGTKTIDGPVFVEIELYPPDHRRRDLDNCLKVLLDSMADGGVYRDDSQIKKLVAEMGRPVLGGKTIVRVKEL